MNCCELDTKVMWLWIYATNSHPAARLASSDPSELAAAAGTTRHAEAAGATEVVS